MVIQHDKNYFYKGSFQGHRGGDKKVKINHFLSFGVIGTYSVECENR